MKRLILILVLLLFFACTDAEKALLSDSEQYHKVQVFSGGKVVGEWVSDGKAHIRQQSDGFYFIDRETGALIQVSGTVIITEIVGSEE